ncbi:MAG: OadG family protein [Clostridia bacterium]|nr:OadG family protein [Clostridia bacterium]
MYSEALLTGNGVTLSEALSTGGITTLVGLSIVFGVLVLLMIVLMLFKLIFYKKPKTQTAPAPAAAAKPAAAEKVEEVDETELIAVLTAAVAASLNTSTYNLKIKSYRRIDNNMPAWNKAGVTETINNRF